ncbi:Peptidase M23 (plasmid) [Phocaeicola salanitronis DSM 18170]|uniref:Peptidase M23 n=1 Tax=Phocaeicola salanitronis (strain DSM 18170 / JCM 13657 / CCUG 60908 / BL78) TaxID=667015 RepID=F0R967_PHOSB|nr:M23 family metallopeptidase [Phocaeicola salanitronis]ADY38188.1 Peptidase M23 [Phocaeicola salanitronis DSM 18170]
MKNNRFAFFLFTCSVSVSAYSQFNTVLQKEELTVVEPTLSTNDARLLKEQEQAVIINDAVSEERLAYWNQRRYLSLPIDSMIVTSKYGKRKDPFTGKIATHKGVDLRGRNDYVYSIMPGIVTKTGKNRGLGNYIEVQHGDFTSIYAHLYNILVNAKQSVEAGQPIGISGSTGRSTGEHLHFQMEYKDKTIDPLPILEYINDVIRTVKGEVTQQIDNALRKR